MSAAVGPLSATNNGSFSPPMEEEMNKSGLDNQNRLHYLHDDSDEEEENEDSKLSPEKELDLGPQFSLKEQLEKDKLWVEDCGCSLFSIKLLQMNKSPRCVFIVNLNFLQDDESLRKWKELLLGSVDLSKIGENKEPEVKIQSLKILRHGMTDLLLPIPFPKDTKKPLFILKEGSRYQLEFAFEVAGNLVSGLRYKNSVWKTGIRVDHSKRMMGSFSPQQQPYTFIMEEETTPSGIFARGSYSARTKFVDDDGKCYLDESYSFEIQKNWPTTSP